MKINESKEHIVNFWRDFNDKEYFYDARGYIGIHCLKLSNNGYIVSIPAKNGSKVILNIDINADRKR